MKSLVIDASIAATWCFEDEATDKTDALADRVREQGALVPGLWHIEVANILLQAEKRGRIAMADATARLELMATLPIHTDTEMHGRAWREILALARAEKLTTYDAAYLELAIRRGAILATLDKQLAAAAVSTGVEMAAV